MELWFSDYHTEKVKVSVKVQKQLFGLQTEFQRIDVFDSDEFGRFLSADGSIVFSEKDEFIYDEMIVHVPMAVHPHVKNVLVIGGGDGGAVRVPDRGKQDVFDRVRQQGGIRRRVRPAACAAPEDLVLQRLGQLHIDLVARRKAGKRL